MAVYCTRWGPSKIHGFQEYPHDQLYAELDDYLDVRFLEYLNGQLYVKAEGYLGVWTVGQLELLRLPFSSVQGCISGANVKASSERIILTFPS